MSLIKDTLRLLSFRSTREDFLGFTRKHLWFGLLGTWLVGMGRHWDDPGAHILQQLGLESVMFTFCLSLFFWLIIKPYRVEKWTYELVLTFISLTSWPAILYAIPTGWFWEISTESRVSLWFLSILIMWRLGLFIRFVKTYTRLKNWDVFVAVLFPICILSLLSAFLMGEKSILNVMGGLPRQSNSYIILDAAFFVPIISSVNLFPLIIGYVIGTVTRGEAARAQTKDT